VLGDDFGFAGVRALARALAEHCGAPHGAPRVIVAYDTRFAGARLAAAAAQALAGAGARPLQVSGAVPTPVATHAVRRRRAAAGFLVTASHNPPEYQGVKIVAPWGGTAPAEWCRGLEARAARHLRGRRPREAVLRGRGIDATGPYLQALVAQVERAPLRRSGLRIFYDAMHGAGAEVMARLWRELGVPVATLHGSADPTFGGAAPDPTPGRLRELGAALRRASGLRLGLASDGDADRFAVLDSDGRMLSETDALALLVDHLARTGRLRRGVAISIATGSLVERVAASYGLSVSRHSIGFGHLTQALLEGSAEVAGDESGGFSLAPFARDKDGLLAGALLAERLAMQARPLREQLRDLRRRHGASCCGRAALPSQPADGRALRRLAAAPPARFDGARVTGRSLRDGVLWGLADGFVLWRRSGTEPVVRLYAEARDPQGLSQRLARAARRLRSARRAAGTP